MEQKVITANSASYLNIAIEAYLADGWVPVGAHTVVTTLEQLVYAGNQHKRTEYRLEYSQTMKKD